MKFNEDRVRKFLREKRVVRTEIQDNYTNVIKEYLLWEEERVKNCALGAVMKSVCELDEWDGGDETNLCDCGEGDGICKRKQTVS